jgi:hypothetical protein
MDSTAFKITTRAWFIWVALYYVTFWFGDPRRLDSGEGLFNAMALLIIIACCIGPFFPKHIGISSFIGTFALAHSLGASLTAAVQANEMTSQLGSQIARLAWVGPSIFFWVWVANKVIVRKDMTECLSHPK